MQDLFNFIATSTRVEIAFGLVIAIILAAFLVPMYVTHCTGRKIQYRGSKAAREWLVGRMMLTYIRSTKRLNNAGFYKWSDGSTTKVEWRCLSFSVTVTLIPRPAVKFQRRAYRASLGKPVYTWWERVFFNKHQPNS